MLVAHDTEAFAKQVVRLPQDRALQCLLARNARRLVEEKKHTWQRSVALLEEVYRRATG